MRNLFEILYHVGSGVSELNHRDENLALQISSFSDIANLTCDAIMSAARVGVALPDEVTTERLHTFSSYLVHLCLAAHGARRITWQELSRTYRMASDLWNWSKELKNTGGWEMGGVHWTEAEEWRVAA